MTLHPFDELERLEDYVPTYLSKEGIRKLFETEEGKKLFFLYISRARSAYCTQEVLDLLKNTGVLGRAVTAEEMQNVCLLIYQCLFKIDTRAILGYAKQVKEKVLPDYDLYEGPIGQT